MISTVWLLSAAIFAVGPILTKLAESGASPAAFAKAGPHHPRSITGRIAYLVAGKILHPVHAVALQPVEGLAGVGVDAHHGNSVGTLALGYQHGGEIGDAEGRAAGADLGGGDAGALADLDGQVDARLLVPALRLGVIIGRVIGRRRPVQDQIDRLARGRRHHR
ncbi:hypothetical protein ACVWW3_002007 [Bradyrhizobium sp. LM2.9]